MAVGGALFSGGGRAAPASKALVEFRAGKMNLSGTTVTPDKRKGLVMVEQGDDDLMHFKWKDRTSGNVEDDLIIFPDDIEFKRVAQCTTGRVYILKFKSSSRKLFFWMQEPKEDKDDEFCKKVNDYLNNPPAAGTSGGSGRSSAGSALAAAAAGIPGLDMSNLRDSELQSLLNHMSQQQLMQLFGEAGGQSPAGGSTTRQRSSARAAAAAASTPAATASTPAAATPPVAASAPAAATAPTTTTTPSTASVPVPASSKAPIQLTDLQSILSGIKVPSGAGGASASGPEVDLSQGLTSDLLQPLLENEEFVRKMKDLLPTVPGDDSGEDAASEIKGTVQSPQFKQALSLFSSGLQTGQLAPLIREFELGDEAVQAAAAGDMEAFVKALQKNVGEKKAKEEEGMDLD